jgi:NAD(P)-dependent dehydrogenase (short-subunit alcohol dehydrogenase family)
VLAGSAIVGALGVRIWFTTRRRIREAGTALDSALGEQPSLHIAKEGVVVSDSRVIVVTGGSSGIGAATVRRFVDIGATVVVLDRVEQPLAHSTVLVDLSNPDSINQAVNEIPASIDVLCNVAGVAGSEDPKLVVGVNFLGLRHLTERVAERIRTGGCVVSVASTAGWYWRTHLREVTELVETPSFAAGLDLVRSTNLDGYNAYIRSKEAVIVWTSHAAQRYRGRLRFTTVSPGAVETPLLPSFYDSMGHEELDPLTELAGGRNGQPDEIAAVIQFLASPDASWVNGTDVVVDGGAEMAFALREQASTA